MLSPALKKKPAQLFIVAVTDLVGDWVWVVRKSQGLNFRSFPIFVNILALFSSGLSQSVVVSVNVNFA